MGVIGETSMRHREPRLYPLELVLPSYEKPEAARAVRAGRERDSVGSSVVAGTPLRSGATTRIDSKRRYVISMQ